jgi:hypothetical protein
MKKITKKVNNYRKGRYRRFPFFSTIYLGATVDNINYDTEDELLVLPKSFIDRLKDFFWWLL